MRLIYRRSFVLCFLHFLILVSIAEPRKLYRPFGNSVSAVLIFGDSTVDPGNNNYVNTLFKSNFAPYGTDFFNRVATGRFTDGRPKINKLTVSYVGIKEYMPAYLDPNLSVEDLRTGVSFASGGSGFDPVTAQISSVIPVQKQLEYFKEYKKKLEDSIGIEGAKSVISKAAFLISAGTNDMIISYFGSPFGRATYNITTYQQSLLQNVQQFLQELTAEGARVIGIVGLPPLGCIPIVITLTSGDAWGLRPCNDTLSLVALDYNKKLQNIVLGAKRNSNSTIIYADIYNPLKDMIQNPSKYGFENTNAGCCGSGFVETTFMCNPKSVVCPDPSKYVFFDSVHPTEATYNYLFKALRPTIDRIIKTVTN
ncbi:GDSL esterase/lipase at5g45960 [Phtheirospermum japonicum]|uniref:GDSL esterase/lipase at5g45960 n=1 Tax=Phtheirospermum japonicum TaxID=374723 RepID=A0A830AYX7_9LAMI|nr:GDSL esterase/lipase at5g45960 [Phtheirospermum japonicum]